jgi:hypothetical protein
VADYTFSPAVVVVESTGVLAIGATGVLRPPDGGASVPVYDLNDSLIPNVAVGPLGVHQAFKSDIAYGVLDFGSVLLPTVSNEVIAAATTLQTNVDTAIDVANAASTTANEALSSAQDAVDNANTKLSRQYTKRTITGNYTLVAGDAVDMVMHCTAATGITITLPQDSAATIGQEIPIPWRQYGAGQITFAAGTGATVISLDSAFKSAGQGAEGLITKVATNTYLISGAVIVA